MADARITALTDLGASVATTDILPVVDSTDTTTKKITMANLLGLVYPVGCIYTETTGTNPATTFGFGTWAAFGQGQVLVGKATAGTFATAGATGGVETHKLSVAEMPVHRHSTNTGLLGFTNGPSGSGGYASVYSATTAMDINFNATAGSGNAHTNLQPYIVVYMWNRTA